jgi:transketolase
VAEVLGELAPVPLARVGVRDVFGTSGEPAELMAHFGLTGADIAKAARKLLEKKR